MSATNITSLMNLQPVYDRPLTPQHCALHGAFNCTECLMTVEIGVLVQITLACIQRGCKQVVYLTPTSEPYQQIDPAILEQYEITDIVEAVGDIGPCLANEQINISQVIDVQNISRDDVQIVSNESQLPSEDAYDPKDDLPLVQSEFKSTFDDEGIKNGGNKLSFGSLVVTVGILTQCYLLYIVCTD
eukprot:TRINITY_DN3524_c0_g1_i1.p2 TRINITY_DN3524_c0_g1~~TRINITY_DN3524_c0_g1_i1.p2  ORF type:complete len:187 (+),score=11.98 TRINITY_DN3524_c0_g1_i1:74-634(+)